MAKIDKSQYTKEEWRKIKHERQLAKRKRRADKALKTNKHFVENLKKQTSTRTKSKVAFVIGNGTSRQGIDLEKLQQYGPVYACNAVYRDMDPDYLVAVDVKMVLELNKAGYQYKNPNVWTNPNKSSLTMKGFNYFQPSKGWSSGPTALWLASQHGYEKSYILGFDFKGIGTDLNAFNNLYADTNNYKKSTDGATFFGNWSRQTVSVIKDTVNVNFIRVILADNYQPEELNNFANFNAIHKEDFIKIFQI